MWQNLSGIWQVFHQDYLLFQASEVLSIPFEQIEIGFILDEWELLWMVEGGTS